MCIRDRLIGFVIASKANLLGAGSAISPEAGMSLFLAALPIAFGGLLSAIAQGKVAASGIAMVGKRPSEAGKAIKMCIRDRYSSGIWKAKP